MLRNRAVALILGLVASPLVFALGLGPIQSSSFLNEPFTGRIELIGAKAADFDALTIRLASLEQFERAGIALNPLLYKLKFAVDSSGSGKDFITITSKDPVREPFLNFLVELNWANGRLLREYTVLLDPPLYDPNRRMAPAAAAPPAPAPVVTPPSTVDAPAADTMAPAPIAAPAPAAYSSGEQIGPVVATDTLWSIASNVRPDDSVTVQQMMLALLRDNPDAFGESNINLLRRGAILRMPDSGSLAALSAAEALAEVRRQHQLWEAYRGQVATTPESQPVGAPAPSDNVDATPPDSGDSRLELVAPGGEDGGGSPGDAADAGTDLLREEIDARAQQAEELSGKLTEAEEIIDLLQRQVNIQDDELAALQARLAELGIEDVDIDSLRAQAESGAGTGDDTTTDEDMVAGVDADTGTGDDDMATMDDDGAVADDGTTAGTDDGGMMDDDDGGMMDDDVAIDDDATTGDDTPVATTPPPAARGFPHSLIPEHIAAMVPGGALTILGLIGAAILGLFAAVISFLMKSRAEPALERSPAVAAPAVAAADDDTDATEDPTITAATETGDDDSEAVTEIGAAPDADAGDDFDPNATVEAEADPDATAEIEAVGEAAPEEDPLEEINVYLAYERFDQAEELVKRVIGEYPDRHEYKLRLLEVYYSSNDRAGYETAARDLLDAVGDSDPLWESAVAMWTEMSPERELFSEGGDAAAEAAAAPADASAFVDITGDAAEEPAAGEDTVAHAPGADDDDELDFDLAGGTDAGDDMLDVTAAAGDSDDILDLTAAETVEDSVVDIAGDDDGVLDLTATADDADDAVLDLTGGDDAVLDLTAGGEEEALDITGGGDDSLLDISSDGGDLLETGDDDGGDLLDVTKTGDISGVDDADLLNVTSPGLDADDIAQDISAEIADNAEDNADLEITDITGADGDDDALDFDISDTVAPAFDDAAEGGDEILDLTGGGSDAATDELLDFDIGGLDDETPGEGAADDLLGGIADTDTVDLGEIGDAAATDDDPDLDITMDAAQLAGGLEVGGAAEDSGELDLDITFDDDDADGGISLQGADLDSAGDDDDFDFALDGTTEMDSIAADDTLDMGAVDTSTGSDTESLDELSQQLDGALDDASLDDLDIEGLEPPGAGDDTAHLDTVALEGEELPEIELDLGDEKTVVMPVSDDVERQSDADEADTKLNLAKAYIELGDNDGARSILNEVSTEGNEAQQAEAQSLLSQLPG